MEFYHNPVMLDEVLENLDPKPGQVFLDGTFGGGGHSIKILERIGPEGLLIGVDRDLEAINSAQKTLLPKHKNLLLVHDNFINIDNIISSKDIEGLDGILLDLGVSSHQLDKEERGFSYHKDADLDMRMDKTQTLKAYDVVNKYSEAELNRIIWDYGEERWAKRIAKFIVLERPINTTGDLVEAIKKAIPAKVRQKGPHPARRTFQAIRIEVNQELELLKESLERAISSLKVGGRIAVISFHSLEDRIIKNTFREGENPCTCPYDAPICICGKEASLKVLTRRPIVPSQEEVDTNPRSRSAKLRIAKRI